MDEATIEITGPAAGIRITLHSRPHAQSADAWDRDASAATVAVAVGAFRGDIPTLLWSHELAGLQDALAALRGQIGHTATAHWRALDGALSLAFALTVPGQIRIDVEAHDRAVDAVLRFEIGADQTYLAEWMGQIRRALALYPTAMP